MSKIVSTLLKCLVALVVVALIAYGVNWGIARKLGEGPFDVLFGWTNCAGSPEDSETKDENTQIIPDIYDEIEQ